LQIFGLQPQISKKDFIKTLFSNIYNFRTILKTGYNLIFGLDQKSGPAQNILRLVEGHGLIGCKLCEN
jgi:hypothetical protein